MKHPDTTISLSVAKEHGFYAGILYLHLREKQAEQRNYGNKYNMRQGVRWIPKLAMAEIAQDLPIFPDAKAVKRAADALNEAGLIRMESTGAFLEEDHVTNRKRDIATWWHISRDTVPSKSAAAYWDNPQRLAISSEEVAAHGIPQALLLAHWRHAPAELEAFYKKLSPVELAKILPLDERTIRRHVKEMVKEGRIIQHAEKPKLYTIPKPTVAPVDNRTPSQRRKAALQ